MQRTEIKEALRCTSYGQPINVRGWVRSRRGNKNVSFIALNDGSTIKNIQIVVDLQQFTEEQLKPVTTGACISATGTLVESQGAGQTVEIQLTELEVYGTADPEKYPLQKKGLSMEFLRTVGSPASAHQHLRRRIPHPPPYGDGYPHLLPSARLLLLPYAAHHGQRLRGCRPDVPGNDQEPV